MSQLLQRANINFIFELGKNLTGMLQELQNVHKGDALKKTTVYEWFD